MSAFVYISTEVLFNNEVIITDGIQPSTWLFHNHFQFVINMFVFFRNIPLQFSAWRGFLTAPKISLCVAIGSTGTHIRAVCCVLSEESIAGLWSGTDREHK